MRKSLFLGFLDLDGSLPSSLVNVMILYLLGSVGKNLELAENLIEVGRSLGGEHELVNLTEMNLPLYSEPNEAKGVPDAVVELSKKMIQARGFVAICPEYNGSLPPVFNNAVAWVSRSGGDDWRGAFNQKYAAVATHSGGGGAKVLAAMRGQLEHLGTTVLARTLLTHFKKSLNPDSAKAVLGELLKVSGEV